MTTAPAWMGLFGQDKSLPPPPTTGGASARTPAWMNLPSTPSATSPGTGVTSAPISLGSSGTVKAKPRSLFQQAKDIVGGVIPGLARAAVTTYVPPVKLGLDVARGKTSPMTAMEVYNSMHAPGTVANPEAIHKYAPFQEQTAQSFHRTEQDVLHLPSHLQQANREGRLIDMGLEDAANLSIVAGPAAEGLSAAAEASEAAAAARSGFTGRVADAAATGFRGAATGAEFAHTMGGKVANAPISVLRMAGEGLAEKRALSGIKTLAEGEGPFAGKAQSLRNFLPTATTEQGKTLYAGAKDALLGDRRTREGTKRTVIGRAGLTGDNPASLDEQNAAVAILAGLDDVQHLQRMVNPLLSDEEIRTSHVLHDIPEQTMTPGVAELVNHYYDGTLPAEVSDRITTQMESFKKTMDEHTASGLAGDGRLSGPIRQEWLGNDPIDKHVIDRIDEQFNDGQINKIQLDEMKSRNANGEAWDQIEHDHPVLTPILDDRQVWPKKWRPMMRGMQLSNENLGKLTTEAGGTPIKLPHRPTDLLAFGAKEPTYFPSVRSNLADPDLGACAHRDDERRDGRPAGDVVGEDERQRRASADVGADPGRVGRP